MGAAEQINLITEQEYLAMERASQTKHEFYDGQVYAMAGASWKHNILIHNLHMVVGRALGESPCRIVSADQRVRAEHRYFYPDVVIVCERPQFTDDLKDTLQNPNVIIEVLSPSTEKFDRQRKFKAYQRIESLQEYILLSQDDAWIERYTRQGDGNWVRRDHGPGETMQLDTPAIEVSVDEIYARVFEDDQDTSNL